jgi:hypothetical protein
VANEKRKKGERVTPKKNSVPPPPAGRQRRWSAPKRIGPFEKPDPDKPLGQVGRRPSSPVKLLVYAVVYFACGIASFFVLKGTLKIIIGVVLIGISLLWLRGASTAMLRIQKRSEES